MLSRAEFIKQSLGIHLFFGRIMKEHSFFLQTGFTPRDMAFANQANVFRVAFDGLLSEAVSLSNGVVDQEIIDSGEIVTPYTLKAEMQSAYYTGVPIQTNITQAESGLAGSNINTHAIMENQVLEQRVFMLNQKAINLITQLIQFKTNVLSNVLSCQMFTVNYPLLIDHILREAKLYLLLIQRLQNREKLDAQRFAYEQEAFWNRIMAEHAKFIRGLLDPTEEELFKTADNFGNEFDELTKEARNAMDKSLPIKKITSGSLKATREIRDFKRQGTQGLLECKIKSIIIPLLGDHVLREANHFLRLLKKFEADSSVRE